MLNNSLVSVKGLSFTRGERVIFDDISLDVPRGKVTAIMGPSGIGKTTLLRLIGGQLQPDKGEICFESDNIPALSRKRLYQVRKKMGMLFQSGALFTDLNVLENVAFPLREHTELSEEMIRTLSLLKLEAVGLRGASQLMPSELSGGMARRAALARAIALDPELIMYDEPFVGQDPITMGILVELIGKLNRALNLTSIVVSHDVPEVMSIADWAYLLVDGRIIAQGSPEDLRNNPDAGVQQFLQGNSDGPVPFRFPSPPLAEELFS
ncbi:phospholipid ABC transporter ATP-binding protein MlaF [Vibrio hippocampi]|uniref:Intermembrane phospholipid transport system ATP-binding protein MlaF n=1 Tax=Vibrio hippocampi TaxID=654686 RepID=A0ABM8ZK73_9VIBR|nr:phospholipid ABC transporter ATP-binding protein MlaF [Vibrio hippocampi]CAH0527186.1 Intermembrane phospholipid transport system ATP-binding protein MlaF [Vibrio hippocampi]